MTERAKQERYDRIVMGLQGSIRSKEGHGDSEKVCNGHIAEWLSELLTGKGG